MEKISPTVKIIEAEMKRQDIGVQELAANIGIAASTLYRILNGEFVPNFQVIEDLLKSLNLKILVKR